MMDSTLGLLLILGMLGMIIYFTVKAVKSRKSKSTKNTRASRLERAVWAWAKVMRSEIEPGTREWRRVNLELEVHTPGSGVCTAKTTWLVEKESLGFIEIGQEISVKADPQDPTFVFPHAPWAKIPE
jgi:hypothetical protein